MNDPATQRELLIWADASRAALIEQTLGRIPRLHVLAVGGPHRAGISDLAAALDTKLDDDLRKMLIDQPAGFLLLTTAAGVTRAELELAQKSGAVILSTEPLAADLNALGDEELVRSIILTPAMRFAPAWLAAAEPQQALGNIQSVQLTAMAPTSVGSLYARLYDALDLLLSIMPTPDTVDAALTGPLKQPPDDLRSLTGNLTAHLRFPNGASAVLHVSDQSVVWSRRLTILGSEAQLDLDDTGYRLLSRDGQTLDDHEHETDAPDPSALIVRQFTRLIDRPGPTRSDAAPHQIIAAAQAALLSCRTGQQESLATLLRMRRGAAV